MILGDEEFDDVGRGKDGGLFKVFPYMKDHVTIREVMEREEDTEGSLVDFIEDDLGEREKKGESKRRRRVASDSEDEDEEDFEEDSESDDDEDEDEDLDEEMDEDEDEDEEMDEDEDEDEDEEMEDEEDEDEVEDLRDEDVKEIKKGRKRTYSEKDQGVKRRKIIVISSGSDSDSS